MATGTLPICTINHMQQKPDTETDSHVVEEISVLYGTIKSTATHSHTHTHNGSFTTPIVGQEILVYNSDFQTVVRIPPVICGRSPGGSPREEIRNYVFNN
jgi:hypothetical protein